MLSAPGENAISYHFSRRLGLFIHWGIYAVPAWQEQHQLRLKVPRAEYAELAGKFNPDAFDPDAWIDLAESAGMTYLVFTAKHLDGFCMWDTQTTDFKVSNTPFGRDTLAELAEACRRRGMPLGLYFSAIDHHCPWYPNRGRGHELAGPEQGDTPDWSHFVDYMQQQIHELCTRYGDLAVFWWDAGNEIGLPAPHLNPLIRELQPGILINDRGMSSNGDFSTPERDWDEKVNTATSFTRPVEACQSVGVQSWGYRRDEDYYSLAYLTTSIQKILAKGGNYLLNVGPRADGIIPPQAEAILAGIGNWFKPAHSALCRAAPAPGISDNSDVLLTRDGNTLYVHLIEEPIASAINLPPITETPERAFLLHTAEPVSTAVRNLPWLYKNTPDRCLSLVDLPVDSRRLAGLIIQLDFSSNPVLMRSVQADDRGESCR